jgi:protein tyrosine phosphatase
MEEYLIINKTKCQQYWPKTTEDTSNFDNLEISLLAEEEILKNAVIQRQFLIKNESETFTITQLQITCWNDHSIPEDEYGYKSIELVSTYIDDHRSQDSNTPILIHCRYFIILLEQNSAGIGRTGTYIAIYNIIKCLGIVQKDNKINEQKVDLCLSVFNVVRKLREQRKGMVTDSIQYKFIYDFTLNWIKNNIDD